MTQQGFDFDVFEMTGFGPSIRTFEDDNLRRRREESEMRRIREEAERKARAERARAERERKAREARENADREERERRRYQSRCESPWDVLGIRPGASGKEIRAAWVAACKRHHPDAGGTTAEMQRVNAAYSALKGQMR